MSNTDLTERFIRLYGGDYSVNVNTSFVVLLTLVLKYFTLILSQGINVGKCIP